MIEAFKFSVCISYILETCKKSRSCVTICNVRPLVTKENVTFVVCDKSLELFYGTVVKVEFCRQNISIEMSSEWYDIILFS